MQVEEKLIDDLLFKVVEMYKRKPLCYMTSPAYLNLEILNSYAHLIPVTTRTEQQFKRIKIPGTTQGDFHSTHNQYAIVSNGAKILVNGVPDKTWGKIVKSKYGSEAETVETVETYLKTLKSSWIKSLMNAEDSFLYMVVDRSEMPTKTVEAFREAMKSYNWDVSIQGRKIYFVPEFLDKGSAFKEVSHRLNADYTMSAGDSILDIPLLEAADIALRPRHGELEDMHGLPGKITVTNNHGIFAGEELTARFLAQVYSGI